jgi:hypothetical protein
LDYLTLPSNSALSLSGDFTIEFFVYFVSTASQVTIWAAPSGAANRAIQSSASNLIYWDGTAERTFGSFAASTWIHIALSRVGSTVKGFYNGSESFSVTDTGTLEFSAASLGYRVITPAGQALNGYLSSFRIVKGSGVTSVTVPTAPLTAITNTSLLLNFTNAGIYDATSKNDLETVGNAQISTTQSKWGGSSMAFDGSGDYLIGRPNDLFNFGTGDFTIEAWVYSTSLATRVIFSNSSGSGTNNITFYITSNGKLNANNFGVAAIQSSGAITANTWNYVAITKQSGTYYFWINGSASGSAASLGTSNNLTDGQCWIGARPGPSDLWIGYIQDLRITKGVARTITASPTAAFPTL